MPVGGRKIQKRKQMQDDFRAFALPSPRAPGYFTVRTYGSVLIRSCLQSPRSHSRGHGDAQMRGFVPPWRMPLAGTPSTDLSLSIPFPVYQVSNMS